MRKKVFKGSFTKTPPSHTTLVPPSLNLRPHMILKCKVVKTVNILYALREGGTTALYPDPL